MVRCISILEEVVVCMWMVVCIILLSFYFEIKIAIAIAMCISLSNGVCISPSFRYILPLGQ